MFGETNSHSEDTDHWF